MLSIVGDSGSGKTTITRGIVRVLGEDKVTHFCADDYHRYDRRQRAERGITPLHPECNYLDVLTCDVRHLRHNEAILKPTYQHSNGTFGPPVYLTPARFVIAEGLLANHTAELRDMFDVRVYLNPPPELRRRWKVARDCSRRGYSTDQVLSELDRREHDSEAFIRPQRHHADMIGSDLHRSDPLALTQLLLLHHLVTARAVIALGGHSPRSNGQPTPEQPTPEPEPGLRAG